MTWNYRVLRSFDKKEYFVAEVYYDDETGTPMSWADTRDSALVWDNYDDLKSTVTFIQFAFDKPVLQVGEGDALTTLDPEDTR